MPDQKKVFIKSYGCQMNVYDSDRMADALAPDGYESVDSAESAVLIVLNTCHIREKAAEKVYSELGRLRLYKRQAAAEGRAVRIAVAGCVAQAEGEEIIARAPVVDMVFGPQSYHLLPEIVARANRGEKVVETEFPAEDKFDHLPQRQGARLKARGATAFLTVQEGCDKFCAFCVVPYTRGAEVSRPVARVVEEATRMAEAGVREITVLGQNVNAYHGEGPDGTGWSLARLLHRLAEVPGLDRLRYTTSHPNDMTDDLIAAHRDLGGLMPYLHLPVQSGSNAILKAMNRRHDRDAYLRLIERIRTARPDIALSGDFIVGFPGETDADFEDTLSLTSEVGYAQAYSFKYSPRPGTPASENAEQVAEEVKTERLSRLQDLLNRQQADFNRAMAGRTTDILVEKPGRHPGQLAGRSPWLQTVVVSAERSLIGSIQPVRITGAGPNSLSGELLAERPAEPAA